MFHNHYKRASCLQTATQPTAQYKHNTVNVYNLLWCISWVLTLNSVDRRLRAEKSVAQYLAMLLHQS